MRVVTRVPGAAAEARWPLFYRRPRGDQVLVIPDGPKATVRIAIHAEHCRLLLRWGRRTSVLRTVAWLLALAVALFAGYPVAGPGALDIAALLHRHLMQWAPVCRAGG